MPTDNELLVFEDLKRLPFAAVMKKHNMRWHEVRRVYNKYKIKKSVRQRTIEEVQLFVDTYNKKNGTNYVPVFEGAVSGRV